MRLEIKNQLKTAALSCSVAVVVCSLFVSAGATASALGDLSTSRHPATAAHLIKLKNQGISNRHKSITNKTQSGNINTTVAGINQALIGSSKRLGFTASKRISNISTEQQTALAKLTQKSAQGGWQARFNSQSGTVALLRSAQHQATAISRSSVGSTLLDVLEKSKGFIRDNAALLKLQEFSDSFSLKSQTRDDNNSRHLRFNQHINGIPVWGKELLLHFNASGEIYQFNGDYLPDGTMPDPIAMLFAEDAIDATKIHLNAEQLDKPTAELVYYSRESHEPVLAWKVDARPKLNQWYHYFVDAQDGHIIHRINNMHTSVAQSSGLDLTGAKVNFNSWLSNDVYFMLDPTFPLNDVTPEYDPINNDLNAKGDTIIVDANNQSTFDNLLHVTSRSANTGWDATAVSVMHNTRIIYDYYLENFGRKSLDDNNMNLLSVIHFDQDWAQAAWNGQAMIYGDGDGQLFGSLAKCFDVAAHEMTHGVITHTANLIYENQSGALNESFADIFAVLMDPEDWTLGEDCTIASPGYLRNLQDPSDALSKQPSKFSDYVNLPNTENGDNGGVHINSGIPNHAFYLTAKDLGHQSTGKIYYRALNTYLTASSQFIDAREALEQSATDLFGATSKELKAVSLAWDTVEVTEETTGPAGSTRPSVTDPVVGDDLMVYLTPQFGSSTAFDIYRQTLTKPFTGYDESKNVGPLNKFSARLARPTVITASNGTFITYVGEDNNLYVINPGADARNDLMIGDGAIWTATFSPDGRYAAYTTPLLEDNQIHIVDLKEAKAYDYPIVLPSYQESASAQSVKVRFADSLSFDYTSEKLVFDVLLCASLPNDSCDESQNSGYNYWGIGTLDVVNGGTFKFPFPSQSPLFSLGYPVFASNNNFVSLLDISFYNSDTELFESGAYSYNYETQSLAPVFLLEPSTQSFYTSPNFWGDDDYATFSYPDVEAGKFVAVRVEVSEKSNWQGADTAITLNPNYAITPVMHRAGVRVVNRDLSISSNSLDFGGVNEDESGLLTLTLTNTGNSDVEINHVTVSNESFSHNASNQRLPRGESMLIHVVFTPSSEKNYAGNLIINSTGNPKSLSVSLQGVNPGGASSSKSSGGGTPLSLLVLLPLIGLLRCMKNISQKRPLNETNLCRNNKRCLEDK